MTRKNFFLSVALFCIMIYLTGCCIFLNHNPSEYDPSVLAEKLKMRKNYWYVMECGEPILFYNDFQDYYVIIRVKDDKTAKNIIYSRNSLDQEFTTFRTVFIDPQTPRIEPTLIEELPPECKGICAHFMYKGKKALFFDLIAFRQKYGLNFTDFFINDGKSGFGYSIFGNLAYMFLCDVSYFQILQVEPDFNLLDLSSIKNKYYTPKKNK